MTLLPVILSLPKDLGGTPHFIYNAPNGWMFRLRLRSAQHDGRENFLQAKFLTRCANMAAQPPAKNRDLPFFKNALTKYSYELYY